VDVEWTICDLTLGSIVNKCMSNYTCGCQMNKLFIWHGFLFHVLSTCAHVMLNEHLFCICEGLSMSSNVSFGLVNWKYSSNLLCFNLLVNSHTKLIAINNLCKIVIFMGGPSNSVPGIIGRWNNLLITFFN
jgi:hypothetical protein